MKKNQKNTSAWHARQGDVLIVRVDSLPSNATKRERDNGRVILAYGEVTGHCHQIDNPDAAILFDLDLSATPQANARRAAYAGITEPVDPSADLLTFLTVDTLSQLVHDEHAAITLEPGTYQVIRQREYTPTELRNVQD